MQMCFAARGVKGSMNPFIGSCSLLVLGFLRCWALLSERLRAHRTLLEDRAQHWS